MILLVMSHSHITDEIKINTSTGFETEIQLPESQGNRKWQATYKVYLIHTVVACNIRTRCDMRQGAMWQMTMPRAPPVPTEPRSPEKKLPTRFESTPNIFCYSVLCAICCHANYFLQRKWDLHSVVTNFCSLLLPWILKCATIMKLQSLS